MVYGYACKMVEGKTPADMPGVLHQTFSKTVAEARAVPAGTVGPRRADPGTAWQARMARTCDGLDRQEFDDESSERHHQAITADEDFYDSLLALLPRLPAPALLITGGQDPLTSAEQRHARPRP